MQFALNLVLISCFFSCAREKKDYSYMIDNFDKNENSFIELSDYFDSITKEHFSVTYGQISHDEIDLILEGSTLNIEDPNYTKGGFNLYIDSEDYNDVMLALNWRKEDIDKINLYLNHINFKRIYKSGFYSNPIIIFSHSDRFCYYIYPDVNLDSVYKNVGKPIRESGFGSRVLIMDY